MAGFVRIALTNNMPPKGKRELAVTAAKKLPAWITNHFEQSLRSIETLSRIVDLSERGISVTRAMPRAIKAIAKAKDTEGTPDMAKQIESAEKLAALAQQEVDKGFPVLHGLAVVALWSWLENFVKGFVVLWLVHRKDAYSATTLQKLRVKLGEYLRLSKTEQAHYVVELMEQDLASPLKRGLARFDSLFEPFALVATPLPDGCAKTLFELQQVRNAIAHRNGNADHQLKSMCPWLKVKLSQPVSVSHEMLHRYVDACIQYLLARFYDVGDTKWISDPMPLSRRTLPLSKRLTLQTSRDRSRVPKLFCGQGCHNPCQLLPAHIEGYPELLWPPATAELRSAWTGEGARPHTSKRAASLRPFALLGTENCSYRLPRPPPPPPERPPP